MDRFPRQAVWVADQDLMLEDQAVIEAVVGQLFAVTIHLIAYHNRHALENALRQLGHPFAIVEYDLNRCAAAVMFGRMNHFLAIERFTEAHSRAGQIKLIHEFRNGRHIRTTRAHPEAESDCWTPPPPPPPDPQQRLAL